MKKIPLYDVPVGKTFVFHHRMYRRVGLFYPDGYSVFMCLAFPLVLFTIMLSVIFIAILEWRFNYGY